MFEALGIPEGAVKNPDPYAIHFHPMSGEMMAHIYSSLDVLLNPATGEGFGIPVLEAQACGTPAIVTDFSAMQEVCGAGWKVEHSKWWTGQQSWQAQPHVADIVEALEACYHRSTAQVAADSKRAREHALQYDVEQGDGGAHAACAERQWRSGGRTAGRSSWWPHDPRRLACRSVEHGRVGDRRGGDDRRRVRRGGTRGCGGGLHRPPQPPDLEGCDVACVFNIALYPPETREALEGKRTIRYFNDVAPHGDHDLTGGCSRTRRVCSRHPLHVERFPWWNGNKPDYHLIPPPVNLKPFRDAAERSQGRAGAVSIAPWRGWGKTPQLTQQWAAQHGPVDFFGGGQCAPPGSVQVPYAAMPDLLARYQTFVYLPSAIEPFCRVAVEAWAAGCDVVVNSLVGARYWIETPEAKPKLDTAAEDFWELVL